MIKKYIKKAATLAAAFVMALAAVPFGAFALETGKPVVVGVNSDYGITASGSRYTGFAYDYLREIAKCTDHERGKEQSACFRNV